MTKKKKVDCPEETIVETELAELEPEPEKPQEVVLREVLIQVINEAPSFASRPLVENMLNDPWKANDWLNQFNTQYDAFLNRAKGVLS
jgi:hypothetical protein